MVLRLILILAVTSAACGAPAEDRDDRPVVAAGLFPLAEAARAVAGTRARVEELVAPGAEPHDAELAPAQVDLLHDADVTVTVEGVQPAVDAVVASREGGAVVIEPEGDVHVWLDPERMRLVTERIADALRTADPAGEAAYERGAARFRAALHELDTAYRAGLARCRGRTIVVSHAAFAAFERYGLRQEAIAGTSPEAEPNPARLAELADLMRREGMRTVFTEPLAPPDVAETLAREVGGTTDVLDPIEAVAPQAPAGRRTYLELMRRNLEALRRGLGC